jgi:multidrug efflux pump subunit AcrA (membrane-fusion protein)
MWHNSAPSSAQSPVHVDEFLPPIQPWLHVSGLFVVAAVALALPVASVTKYQTTVKAPAIVAVSTSNTQTPLRLKAVVPANNINQIRAGQGVQIRLSGCPHTDYGTLQGTVAQIISRPIQSPTNSATAATPNYPSPFSADVPVYEITIAPQHLVLDKGGHQCPLRPGMDGRADISSGEETVLSFLIRKARLAVDF